MRDGEPVRLTTEQGHHEVALDLLDACLAAGVPVTDPRRGTALDLAEWLDDKEPGRRDLAAVAADPRYAPLLRAAVEKAAAYWKDPAIWSGSPRTRCSGRSPGPGSPSGRRIWAVRSDCRSWSGS